MTRRSGVILVCSLVLLGLLAALGGAGAGNAGPRIIDPFTATATPSPGELGRRVNLTIFFHNNSKKPLTQANLTANAGLGTFFDFSSSQGTCGPDPNDTTLVNCAYGKLEKGVEVTTTIAFTMPSSIAASDAFDVTLFTNENCTNPTCDPGSQSVYHPAVNPVTVPLNQPSDNKLSDVVPKQGGTFKTADVTATNDTSFSVTAGAFGQLLPIVLAEFPTDPAVCGSEAEAVRSNADLTLPGTFSPPVSILIDVDARNLPLSRMVACNDGAVIPDCAESGELTLPCLDDKDRVVVNGVTVNRLFVLTDHNGKWGGGLG